MGFILKNIFLPILLLSSLTLADTPPPSIVKLKGATDNTPVGNVTDSLKVNVTNIGSSLFTVSQGPGGGSPWLVTALSWPLPTGASTEAKQDAGNASLTSVLAQLDVALSTRASQATVASILGQLDVALSTRASELTLATLSGKVVHADTGNVTIVSSALPTGAATAAKQDTGNSSLSSLDSKFNTLGQKTAANSAPVVIASDQSAIPVTGTFFQAIQPVSQSGAWTTGRTWTLSSGTDSVNVGNFPATQAVTQSTSPWVSNISQFGGSNVVTGTGTGGAGIPRVTVSNDSNVQATQSGTWNINNVSGTVSLPTGASTETTLAKLTQTQGSTTSGQSGPLMQGAVSTNAPTYTNGQTSPLSLTTRGDLRITIKGGDSAQIIRNDYSTTNVTTAAYVQLVASTTNNINRVWIFDSSGQDFVLATGAAASEVDQIQIPPGGWDAPVDIFIPSGSRLSIKSKSATASSGILLISAVK